MSLVQALRDSVYEPYVQARPPEVIEHDVGECLSALLQEQAARQASHGKASTSSSIPSFFKPKPHPGSLQSKKQIAARVRKEEVQRNVLLTDEDLQEIWFALKEESRSPPDDPDPRVDYDNFCEAWRKIRDHFQNGPQLNAYFKAAVFLSFEQDVDGCISAGQFATYLSKRSHMHGMRVLLSPFDPEGRGVLTELQLEEFIGAQAMDMAPLADMEPSFVHHYKRIAARKFLFFHGNNSVVSLKELAGSPVLRELRELAAPGASDGQLMDNWFSLQSTRRVFNTFQNLGGDMNGLLSRAEFAQISNDSMSPFFIHRIFEVHVMQQRALLRRNSTRDEMDLVAFTDFVLAWDHRGHPAAIKYFFDIFDLNKQGYITPAELYTFFLRIHDMWVAIGEYADLAVYDVVDEILDMVNPKVHCHITPEDLANSRQSGIFFSILSDVRQFQDYNSRENNIHQDDDQ